MGLLVKIEGQPLVGLLVKIEGQPLVGLLVKIEGQPLVGLLVKIEGHWYKHALQSHIQFHQFLFLLSNH